MSICLVFYGLGFGEEASDGYLPPSDALTPVPFSIGGRAGDWIRVKGRKSSAASSPNPNPTRPRKRVLHTLFYIRVIVSLGWIPSLYFQQSVIRNLVPQLQYVSHVFCLRSGGCQGPLALLDLFPAAIASLRYRFPKPLARSIPTGIDLEYRGSKT